MSFLIDPPWLYANGRAYAALAPERAQGAPRRSAPRRSAGFWAVSISLYLNRRWTQRIWEACRADDGRDWMLNSGVFRFDHRNAGRHARGGGRAVRHLPGLALARLQARPPMSAPVFADNGTRGHYESFYLRAVDPERAARRLAAPHRAQRARRRARRLGLVHRVRRRAPGRPSRSRRRPGPPARRVARVGESALRARRRQRPRDRRAARRPGT